MASTSKRKTSHWYGYLNAGKRSSPVLRDERLDTGNPKTLYLYNLARGQILEYAREIVDNKLRELKAAESGYIAELDAGYKKARRSFKARVAGSHYTAGHDVAVFHERKDRSEDEDSSDFVMDDSDMWEDAEEA